MSVLNQNSFDPTLRFVSSFLSILLFFYLTYSFSSSRKINFANTELIIFLTSSGFICIFFSDLFGFIGISNLSSYLQLVGNLLALISIFLFSTKAIIDPYLTNQRSLQYVLFLVLSPLAISFLSTIAFLNRQLMVQIITTSLAQTLNITIFREIPGLSNSVQPFFLILSISAIFLAIFGFSTLFNSYDQKEYILSVLIVCILGLEIFTPFINIIRLISIACISGEFKGDNA
ncbi:MAG: hypothetical protein ACXAC8_06985 [Candidatus Hodarchaeales archaeon]